MNPHKVAVLKHLLYYIAGPTISGIALYLSKKGLTLQGTIVHMTSGRKSSLCMRPNHNTRSALLYHIPFLLTAWDADGNVTVLCIIA